MRERNRFSNQKRGPELSRSSDVRRFESSRRHGQTKRGDQTSFGGNLFALFGFDNSGKRQATARSRHLKNRTMLNRVTSFRQPSSGAQASRRSRRAGGSVVPLKPASANRSRRNQRRPAVAPTSQNLLEVPTPRTKSGKLMLYGMRLLVFGIGIGVITGTMLSVWDPASRLSASSAVEQAPTVNAKPVAALELGQEMSDLKQSINNLVTKQPDMQVGAMFLDLDTDAYVDLNATTAFPAASTIKFPVLVAFFQAVDAGKIQLNEMLTMKKEQVATEAGTMQYQPVGTKFSALETATEMMVDSDNTATNMLIDRLGGMAALNQQFQQWGLTATTLHNLLPDIEGTNTTTPQDMALLMSQIQDGKLVSMKSRDRLLDIMGRIRNDSMLPQGLGDGAKIAHKTGTLGLVLGDIGLIDTPTGKRYLAAVLVKRPRDDYGATELVQNISRLAYQRFNQTPAAAPKLDQTRIAQPPN